MSLIPPDILDKLPAEYKTLQSGKQFQPWKITLWVMDTRFDTEFRGVSYFVRGLIAEKAIGIAERLWTRWEKNEKGMEHQPFPDVLGRGHAVCIDEGDWAAYHKDAINHGAKRGLEMLYVGDFKHPLFWTVPGLTFDILADERPTEQDYIDAIAALPPPA